MIFILRGAENLWLSPLRTVYPVGNGQGLPANRGHVVELPRG